MTKINTQLSLMLAMAAAPAALALSSVAVPTTAEAAVVYCTSVGYPRGCVVRPAPVRTVTRVVYCTRPGYPIGCAAGPSQARALARPGPGVNLNGGFNGPGLY